MTKGLHMAAVLVAAIVCASAPAQPYPSKPIRFVTVGGDDVVPRLVAQAVSVQLGQ